jgi:hypothetical protein
MKLIVKVALFMLIAAGAVEGVTVCCGNPPCEPPIVCSVK